MSNNRQYGMSLIELMVALVIGSILIIGAVSVYMQSRSSYRVNEAVARLQENARFALDTLEPDIRLARFWGQTSRTNYISAGPAAFAVNPDCGVNWAVDIVNDLAAQNNEYTLTCASFNGNPSPDADVLIVRHASANPVAAVNDGRIRLQSDRAHAEMFVGSAVPAGFVTTSESFNLVTHAYYISQDSTGTPGVPSLRRKFLTAGPLVTDEEIISGVEDLQVQLGVDTDGDGAANQYVNPGAVPAGADIIAVRLWLRLRTEGIEVGFVDDNAYAYADNPTPGPFNDNFRRLVMSKTILLRNTRL